MKKKGFTLVELLAVIAILAILVIIALPNIMDLFNQAKKNSFSNEVKNIFKEAQQEFMSTNMSSPGAKKFARRASTDTGSCGTTELKLSGRTNLQYGITLNSNGTVTKFVATDGTFVYNHTSGDLTIDQIASTDIIVAAENDTYKDKTITVICDGTTDYKISAS